MVHPEREFTGTLPDCSVATSSDKSEDMSAVLVFEWPYVGLSGFELQKALKGGRITKAPEHVQGSRAERRQA